MKCVIHIFGASGSGTTTLGAALSAETGFYAMDTDDYYWEQTDPPYTVKREPAERLRLMRADIERHKNVVISGSVAGWGDPLIPEFTLVVRLFAPTQTRLERLHRRELLEIGERILPGGELAESHEAFLRWAAAYDTGDTSMRSKLMHDIWQQKLTCPLLTLDGTADIGENCRIIREAMERIR